jgi:hypothetical protein
MVYDAIQNTFHLAGILLDASGYEDLLDLIGSMQWR